jgi:hypothetical protein
MEQVAKQQARADRLRAELDKRKNITEQSFMHAGWGHLLTLEREIRTGLQALLLSPRSRASARIPEAKLSDTSTKGSPDLLAILD